MKSEPLDIFDKRFLINRLIDQAPKQTLIREFFKNADENAFHARADARQIIIAPVEIDGVPKLSFWNTGQGMDDVELKRATDLSSSINKEMALDGNFGIGAKVSGLTASPHGIRYRSCKNGVVNEVTIGFDEEAGTYVRFPVQLPDGSFETVYDVSEAARASGQDLSFDWTEVVLFGEDDGHDTVQEPLGRGVSVERSYVASTIFRRFSRFSPHVEVKIDVSMTKGGGKGETGRFRALKTLEDILDKLPNHERVRDASSGVVVHYIHDPKHHNYSHSLSALANPATSSTSFCAIVHKGERYDYKTSKAWSAAAPNFGIPFGSRVLTIEIEIPDHAGMPNQYRDSLTWPEDRSAMIAEHFAPFVRELMPEWVKDVIHAESPKSDENLDDLRSDLQKLLDEFRVPTVTLTPSTLDIAKPVVPFDDGEDSTERTDLHSEFGFDRDDEDGGLGERDPSKTRRAQNKKFRQAPEGAKPSKSSQALERVPEIRILTEPDEIAEKNIKGRAGRYYKDAQTLFINGLYPVIERMTAELEPEFRGQADPETLRNSVLLAARRLMAYRVGKATCYAISKRLADDWSSDDLDRATSPESLSLAADDYKQSLRQAQKIIKDLMKTAALPDQENLTNASLAVAGGHAG